MSTAPDGRWRPTNDLMAAWLAVSFLGLCFLNGVGLIALGLKARRPSWWIPGIVYLVAGPAFVLYREGTPKAEAGFWIWAAIGCLAAWVVSLVHLLGVAVWVRWPTDHPPSQTQPPAPDPLPEPVGLPAGLAPPPGDYYGPGPAARAAPVDVNAAGPEQLGTLPGFDPGRVRQVLAERLARRGFGSVEEFAAAANLAPHEFVRVRNLVVCAPVRAAQPEPPAQGRILDV